jgi:hypothetical protein
LGPEAEDEILLLYLSVVSSSFVYCYTHTKTFGFHDTTVLMGWEFMPFELRLWYIIEAAFCPHNNIRLTKVFVSSGKKAWGNFLAQENIEHS